MSTKVVELLESLRDVIKADGWRYGDRAKVWSPDGADTVDLLRAFECLSETSRRMGLDGEDASSEEIETLFARAIRRAQPL